MTTPEITAIIFGACAFILLCALISVIVIFSLTEKKRRSQRELFLSRVAHDMRSPLTSVKGFADGLLDGSIPEEKREECLAVISAESDRLARLSSRLCGKTDLSPKIFGLCDVVRRAYLLSERKISAKGISVSFSFSDDDEIYVLADEDAVFEIVLNLFENAAKYCDNGGKICWKIKEKASETEICVSNTAKDVKNIDFFKARTRSESSEHGYGLGLYITKNLVNDHGKSINITAEEGVFSVSFSLDTPKDTEI